MTRLGLVAAVVPVLAAPGLRADDIRIVNANIITMGDANPAADQAAYLTIPPPNTLNN